MKNVLNNKKGFTLIELLAVIVILAILVMVAIPAVTKYLNAARQGTYVDNARSAISAVRNDVIISGGNDTEYTLDDINKLLEKKLYKSPFGSCYCADSKITISYGTDGAGTYSILLKDSKGRGILASTEENALKDSDVVITMDTTKGCASTAVVSGCTDS